MDNLKSINDNYGHDEGDRALKEVTLLLEQSYRESDIVGRLGGDEFSVLCICSPDSIEEIINRLNTNIIQFNSTGKLMYDISLSYGYIEYEMGIHSSVEELLKEADELMYKNKKKRHD
jgi:diguanylate cyclase (GGDEF) domain